MTYAEHAEREFSVFPETVQFLAVILDAASRCAKVTVKIRDEDARVEGVARHVVGPETIGFADTWTERSRLRVTTLTGWERFIPLGNIEAIVITED